MLGTRDSKIDKTKFKWSEILVLPFLTSSLASPNPPPPALNFHR